MILLGFIRYQMMIPIEMGGQKGELIGTVRQIDGKKVILKNIQIQGLENLPKIGQKIKVTGKICDFQKATNFGQFDVRSYYQSRQIYGYMKVKNYEIVDARYNRLKQGIYQIKLALSNSLDRVMEDSSVLKSILLGDRSELSDEINEIYQSAGIAHVLSVSGLHISLLGIGLYRILKRLLKKRWIASGISIFIMVSYCIMVGSRPSSIRAVIGFILSLAAELLGRDYDMATSMAISGIIILWQSPRLLFQSGFQYSFLAVIAIARVVPAVCSKLFITDNRVRGLVFSICLQIVMLPAILFYQYSWPVLGIFLNLIVIPLLSIVVLSGVSGAIVGLFFIKVARFLILPAKLILDLYEKMGEKTIEILTGKPHLIQIGIYTVILVFIFIICERHRRRFRFFVLERKKDIRQFLIVGYLMVGMVISTVFLHHIRYRGLEINFLDVGQGDGIIIQLPDKKVVAIDGGSSSNDKLAKYVLEPFLKACAIKKIDAWFISHPDSDHYNGLLECQDSIDKIYLTSLVKTDELVKSLQRPISFVEKGDAFTIGDVKLKVLYPTVSDSIEDMNDTSMLLQLSYHNFTAIFTGDLSKKVPLPSKIDLLKIAHHGSKNSISLLEEVKPKVAVISVGKTNRYGHPHQEILKRLEEIGSIIRRTDEKGEIVIRVK